MKIISISRGKRVIVDDEDYDRLISMGPWFATAVVHGSGGPYAVRKTSRKKHPAGKQKTELMHRIIMRAKKGEMIDHINGNGLDNRKVNLRFCTASTNQMNRKSVRGSTSKFKGVCWNKKANKWQSQIKLNGVVMFVGLYEREFMAARAYDRAAREHHGKFARLNFPDQKKRKTTEHV